MTNMLNGPVRDASLVTLSLLVWNFGSSPAEANPTGGSVAQGSATFNSAGSQFTVHTGANTVINWQSFNIGAGETTTFVEPSSTSVVWNHINDSNPSQILGNLNANGYVVLQNQNGFVVGGDAAIKAPGLIMTTSPTPPPNLSAGGAWVFDAPPPSASIINYGQINITGGGTAYLIADNIQNDGTISAPQGHIGLYAGEKVLVSTRPDGHGLNAAVTLPQGSVDNEGKLIADGGTIAAMAQSVNQNGLAQANSVQDVNGVIELVASDNLNLGADSVISAQGADTGVSSGGSVTIKSDNTFSDQLGSIISIAGGAQGGNGGELEISASKLGQIQSRIDGHATAGFFGGALTIDPTTITLDAPTELSYNNEITTGGLSQFTVSADEILVTSSWTPPSSLTGLNLTATDDITVETGWNLPDATVPSLLSMFAGNSIIFSAGASLTAGRNWSLDLIAGTAFTPTGAQPTPAPAGGDGSYNYGVYLDDGAYVQTQNGDITVSAVNEVIIHNVDLSTGALGGAIRTMAGGNSGGNINVTTQYGDVNTGNNILGYDFDATSSYIVDPSLGGISTAAGGNVTINAGGNVISYLPTQYDFNNYNSQIFPSDPNYSGTGGAGTGAFGSGNVSITAGGSVFGNYVVANGIGTIKANGNAGSAVDLTDLNSGFDLSLIKGSWTVNAQNIYLNDVLNPNGIFNDVAVGSQGYHNFDYDPSASVSLTAANAVEITGGGNSADSVPRRPPSDPGAQIPVLLPPSLQVITGNGGLTLDTDVILFPSSTGNGNLSITTQDLGNFVSRQNPADPADVNTFALEMSDSGNTQWRDTGYAVLGNEVFGYGDRATTPTELNNPNPVEIHISGSMDNVNLYATKQTDITIDGDMFNSGFVGQNLHAGDVTSINVLGKISFSPIYTFITLNQTLPDGWQSLLGQLVDDTPGDVNSVTQPIPGADIGNNDALKTLAGNALLFSSSAAAPAFVYNPATLQLGYTYQMSSLVRSALEGKMETIQLDSSGNPIVQLGQASLGQDPTRFYFATTTISFVPGSEIETLYQNSQASVKDQNHLSSGLQLGGPGQFDVTANSMDLGASSGIVSWGAGNGGLATASDLYSSVNYGNLTAVTKSSGASVDVTVTGDLGMLTSTIASIGGGDVTVKSEEGEIDLGLSGLSFIPPVAAAVAYGIYSAAAGDVTVTADGNINIDTARIGTFNGGNVFVESYNGDVNAGNGVNVTLNIPVYLFDPKTGFGQTLTMDPKPYGSGVLAISPTAPYQLSPGGGELPGNITVETPNGNIVSTLGGIAQFALNGNVGDGPTVNLTAGTANIPASATEGNVDLGQGGVIGGSVNVSATGDINGLIVSRQNTSVQANQNVNVTVLSGGNANVAAGGTLSGTLVSEGGINASGGQGISATMLSSSVSANGGTAQNSLGVATASAQSQSAANQSDSDTKQQLASNVSNTNDDQDKKKRVLAQRVKRVTVILPKS